MAAGKATMPINDTFWGDYRGMLTDKFGVQWIVNYHKDKMVYATCLKPYYPFLPKKVPLLQDYLSQ